MAAEGKTQQQIAEALDVDQKTVSNVLQRIRKNNTTVETPKPLPELPDLFEATEEEPETPAAM
jgi:DNA-binding transcriptional regulator LsrR (DeoR family)